VSSISTNTITVVGRLGQDPESKTVGSTDLTSFSIAVSQGVKDGQEKTMWLKINVWGKSAPACSQYLSKGSKVAVTGRLDVRQWESDAGKGTSVEINASSVEFLDSRQSEAEETPDLIPF
jgi:single-strand DNA-binding protein